MPTDPNNSPLDDTQPTQPFQMPSLEDTQPVLVMPPGRISLWLVVAALVMIGIAALVTVAAFVALNREAKPLEVVLLIDNQSTTLTTHAQTVAELFNEQNLILEAGDIPRPDLYTRLEDGMSVQLLRARTVSITIDGRTTILRTTYTHPQDILNTAGIQVDGDDRVFIDGTEAQMVEMLTWAQPVYEIRVQSAITVYIQDGDTQTALQTSSDTVGEALFDAGIQLYVVDGVNPPLDTPLTPEMQIMVDRSKPVTIIADGSRTETRTSGRQIIDALAEIGIPLSGLDYTIPSETNEIVGGMSVRVIRVTEDLLTETETIPYETIYQADANMELDHHGVIQAGLEGVIERTIRVRYENGVEISRTLETETQVSAAKDQIIAYGTNIIIRTLDTPEGPIEYWRKLNVYATSYHPEALGGDNITAIGETLRKGIVGIDPDIIPYRSWMYIEGYGSGMAADTGAPRANPYWIDLGYEDHDWINWHRWVNIYLLTPIPAEVDYFLPVTERGGPVP